MPSRLHPCSCLDRLRHTISLTTVYCLASLLDLLEDLLVGEALVSCDIGGLGIEGDVI